MYAKLKSAITFVSQTKAKDMNTHNLTVGQEIMFTTLGDAYYIDGEHHYKVERFNDKSVWLFCKDENNSFHSKSLRLSWNTLNKYLGI